MEFTSFSEIDLAARTEAVAEQVLVQLHTKELITDADVAQILSHDHTGFSVHIGDPFPDTLSERLYP